MLIQIKRQTFASGQDGETGTRFILLPGATLQTKPNNKKPYKYTKQFIFQGSKHQTVKSIGP